MADERILITASTLPRWADDAMPAFVLDQAVAITQAFPGTSVEILAPHHAGAARDETLQGIRIHRFQYFWPSSLQRLAYTAMLPTIRQRPWLVLQVPAFLVAEFFAILIHARRFRPTVLYSHWFTPQALAGSLAARLLGIPHVFTSHSADVEVLRYVPLVGPALVRRITRACHACTAVSRRTAERLQAFFEPAEWQAIAGKLQIIPMGVHVNELADKGSARKLSARQTLGLGDTPTVLFIGRLAEKKGLHDLLHAAAKLQQQGCQFELVIAGDGPLKATIEEQVRQLGLNEKVSMPGFVSGEAKQAWITAADIMVVPSIVTDSGDVEGLPVSLMEGMAAGKVCVASDASGADDVLTHGMDGYITHAGDPDALAEALADALSLDPAMLKSLGQNAAKRALELDWLEIARSHYSHLFADLDAGPGADDSKNV